MPARILRSASSRSRRSAASVGTTSTPRSPSRSSASRIRVAPSRISCSGTSDRALVTEPATAYTSRPNSIACSAVIIEPLPLAPSTTTVARLSPATIRLRAGNWCWLGGVPGAYSLTSVPAPPIRRIRARLADGYATSSPDPRTASVGPLHRERAIVGRGVDAAGGAAHDGEPGERQSAPDRVRRLPPRGGAAPGADRGNGRGHVRRRPTDHVDGAGWIGDLAELARDSRPRPT